MENDEKIVAYDGEQYRAIVRVRYRRWLARRGIPSSIIRLFRTLPELRASCQALVASRKANGE